MFETNLMHSKKLRHKESMDLLMIAETKIDATFPTGQFAIEGFATPFRLEMQMAVAYNKMIIMIIIIMIKTHTVKI